MRNKIILIITLLLAIVQIAQSKRALYVKSANNQNQVVEIPDGEPIELSSSVIAYAEYSDPESHPSHFGHLKVVTVPSNDDFQASYAAGLLEGYLTAELIYANYLDMLCQVDCNGNVPENITKFFDTQEQWILQMIKNNPNDNFWKMVNTIQQQFEGLMQGYAISTFGQNQPLSKWAFRLINAVGDLFEIVPATVPEKRKDFNNMEVSEIMEYLQHSGHCSAIIKMTDDFSDILAGHSTWFTYSAMNRIFKRYELNLANPILAAKKVAFSSYPGMLSSWDDFYMMDSGLLMIQTTNSVLDNSLLDNITPNGLFAWQRVRLANSIAKSGPEYFKIIENYNSGTYNNQYMVLNYGLFKKNNALAADTLWVIEQIPGEVFGSDKTQELQRSYWASYNVPYYEQAYIKEGFADLDSKGNKNLRSAYYLAPRGKIFRRDHHKVKDLDTLKQVLRSNEYENDPFAEGNPSYTICSRGDLKKQGARADGCIDTKVTNFELFNEMKLWLINGPSADNYGPFSWSNTSFSDLRVGQADKFDFTFELFDDKQTIFQQE